MLGINCGSDWLACYQLIMTFSPLSVPRLSPTHATYGRAGLSPSLSTLALVHDGSQCRNTKHKTDTETDGHDSGPSWRRSGLGWPKRVSLSHSGGFINPINVPFNGVFLHVSIFIFRFRASVIFVFVSFYLNWAHRPHTVDSNLVFIMKAVRELIDRSLRF